MQLKLNFKRVCQTLAAAVTSAALGTSALAQDCPEPTVAERIDAAISPITDYISGLVFAPIPVISGSGVSTATILVDETSLADGDGLTIGLADKTLALELDTNSLVCSDAKPVLAQDLGPITLAKSIEALIAPTGSVEQQGNEIVVTVPSDRAPSLETTGSAIRSTGFSDGSAGLPVIVVWLLAGAAFFTLKMRFINIRGFAQAIRIARGTYDDPNDPGEVTHFQALTAALSGTVGLGNIAGVAVAISLGGPGATFWMILAGLLGMSSKFTECTLGVLYRKISDQGVVSGGPMYYLRDGLAEHGMAPLGRFLAAFFAVLCIGGAFGAGNMFQVNQSAEQVIATLVPLTGGEASIFVGKPWIVGLVFAFFVGLVILGGIRSITKVTEKLVPLMAFIYLSGALTVIGLNITAIPSAFVQIITGAFTADGVVGGFIGVLVIGLRRATFSNEAGVGSAAIAHSAAKTKEPVSEGLVALLEPFIDTVVICTITALVLIVTDMHVASQGLDGITLTSNAFASVIDWFPYVLTLAVVLFAFSTSITWFYYGQRAFLYLMGNRPGADIAIKVAYLLTLVIGSSMTLGAVMSFADAMLLAMAFPNMIGLYILAPKVKAMLDHYLARVRSGDIKPVTHAV